MTKIEPTAFQLAESSLLAPNGIDEGGLADDEVAGPPKTLAGFRISDFDWDGATLVLALANDAAGDIFQESGLRLRLVVKPVR